MEKRDRSTYHDEEREYCKCGNDAEDQSGGEVSSSHLEDAVTTKHRANKTDGEKNSRCELHWSAPIGASDRGYLPP